MTIGHLSSKSRLTVLLAVTLVYCIVLERRLAAVRKGQEGLKAHHRRTQHRHLRCRRLPACAEGDSRAAPPTRLDERLKRARAAYRRIVGADRLRRAHRRALRPRCDTAGCDAHACQSQFQPPVRQHHGPPGRFESGAMNALRRYFRLLPAVVAVGVGLLAIKGVDLARAAQAPATNSDMPDNTGLAPTDTGGAKPARRLCCRWRYVRQRGRSRRADEPHAPPRRARCPRTRAEHARKSAQRRRRPRRPEDRGAEGAADANPGPAGAARCGAGQANRFAGENLFDHEAEGCRAHLRYSGRRCSSSCRQGHEIGCARARSGRDEFRGSAEADGQACRLAETSRATGHGRLSGHRSDHAGILNGRRPARYGNDRLDRAAAADCCADASTCRCASGSNTACGRNHAACDGTGCSDATGKAGRSRRAAAQAA